MLNRSIKFKNYNDLKDAQELLEHVRKDDRIVSVRRFYDEEEEDEEGTQDNNVFIGFAIYRKELVRMASILSACTEVLGNAKKSLNDFYWQVKSKFCRN